MSAVRPYGFRAGLGPVQMHYAEPQIMANVVGSAVLLKTGAARVRIETPDSRLRVKVSILFIRREGDPTTRLVSNLGATLYVGEEENDQSGYRGGKVLCTDVLRDAAGNVIHQAAPLPIPEAAGLEGFTFETVTAADSLLLLFTTANGTGVVAGATGIWVAQARFQPDGQRLHDNDWDYVVRNCKATLISPEVKI